MMLTIVKVAVKYLKESIEDLKVLEDFKREVSLPFSLKYFATGKLHELVGNFPTCARLSSLTTGSLD